MTLLAAALCGCAHDTPVFLPAARVGPTDNIPIGVVTGKSSAFFFFSAPPLGDATTQAAMRDARSKMDNDGLINVSVDHRSLCFPVCAWPLFSYVRTTVTGTLVRYFKDPDVEPPKAPAQVALPPGAMPPLSEQQRRLEELFSRDPAQAASFWESLDPDVRGRLRDYVLSQNGVLSAYDTTFKAPADDARPLKRFLRWFVPRYTAYQLVFE